MSLMEPLRSSEWRVGKHYNIHVYEGDRPVATFLDPVDAARAVADHNHDGLRDALRALSDAATAGPWERSGYDVYETHTTHGDLVIEAGLSAGDAAYVTALVNWHRALLTEETPCPR